MDNSYFSNIACTNGLRHTNVIRRRLKMCDSNKQLGPLPLPCSLPSLTGGRSKCVGVRACVSVHRNSRRDRVILINKPTCTQNAWAHTHTRTQSRTRRVFQARPTTFSHIEIHTMRNCARARDDTTVRWRAHARVTAYDVRTDMHTPKPLESSAVWLFCCFLCVALCVG